MMNNSKEFAALWDIFASDFRKELTRLSARQQMDYSSVEHAFKTMQKSALAEGSPLWAWMHRYAVEHPERGEAVKTILTLGLKLAPEKNESSSWPIGLIPLILGAGVYLGALFLGLHGWIIALCVILVASLSIWAVITIRKRKIANGSGLLIEKYMNQLEEFRFQIFSLLSLDDYDDAAAD